MISNTDIDLLFCGDLAPTRRLEALFLNEDVDLFSDIQSDLDDADFKFVNLECPLTNWHVPIKKSGPSLKANPDCIKKIANAGFDVVGLANNHIMDYGAQGLRDTLAVCKANGVDTVGAGETLVQAQKIYFFERKHLKIALIALAEHEFNLAEANQAGASPLDLIDNFHQIQFAKSRADVVVITIHGGNEYFPYPRPNLRKLCQHFIDLGCSAVMCHHPHVPGAYEYHQGKPIVYSLGNFLFDNAKDVPGWEAGYMAQLRFDSKTKNFQAMHLIPYRQHVSVPGIKKFAPELAAEFLQKIAALSHTLQNENAWMQAWHAYCDAQTNNYIARQYSPWHFRGLGLLARHTPLARMLLWPSSAFAKLNLLRCQSHHELLIEVIKRWTKRAR